MLGVELLGMALTIVALGWGAMKVFALIDQAHPSPSQRPEAWGIGVKPSKEATPFDDWDKRFAEEHLARIKPDAREALRQPYRVPEYDDSRARAVAGEYDIRVEMTGHGGGGGGSSR